MVQSPRLPGGRFLTVAAPTPPEPTAAVPAPVDDHATEPSTPVRSWAISPALDHLVRTRSRATVKDAGADTTGSVPPPTLRYRWHRGANESWRDGSLGPSSGSRSSMAP